jgi:hypothetical protein
MRVEVGHFEQATATTLSRYSAGSWIRFAAASAVIVSRFCEAVIAAFLSISSVDVISWSYFAVAIGSTSCTDSLQPIVGRKMSCQNLARVSKLQGRFQGPVVRNVDGGDRDRTNSTFGIRRIEQLISVP